jgi:hypothetical protein
MARHYSNAQSDITREMGSWGSGGYRYQANELDKAYTQQMHGLQMDDYNRQRKDLNDPWGMFTDFMTAGLSGAGSGAAMGNQIDKWWEQRGK